MSQKVWEINGLSLELDLADIDSLEHYEKAFADVQEKFEAIPKDGKASVQIRAQCEIIRGAFNDLFGEETAEKLFSDAPSNIMAYLEIYRSFVEFATSQLQEQTAILNKYIPDRQQKRGAAKRKK